MSSPLDRLKSLTNKISSYEVARKENLVILKKLYNELNISDKVENFEMLFEFKALNLSGASLSPENFGEIKKGRYLQLLAISYDKNAKIKSKNISLGYFGRVENVDEKLKNRVVEFVIRFRFEKSFMNLQHYSDLLERL